MNRRWLCLMLALAMVFVATWSVIAAQEPPTAEVAGPMGQITDAFDYGGTPTYKLSLTTQNGVKVGDLVNVYRDNEPIAAAKITFTNTFFSYARLQGRSQEDPQAGDMVRPATADNVYTYPGATGSITEAYTHGGAPYFRTTLTTADGIKAGDPVFVVLDEENKLPATVTFANGLFSNIKLRGTPQQMPIIGAPVRSLSEAEKEEIAQSTEVGAMGNVIDRFMFGGRETYRVSFTKLDGVLVGDKVQIVHGTDIIASGKVTYSSSFFSYVVLSGTPSLKVEAGDTVTVIRDPKPAAATAPVPAWTPPAATPAPTPAPIPPNSTFGRGQDGTPTFGTDTPGVGGPHDGQPW